MLENVVFLRITLFPLPLNIHRFVCGVDPRVSLARGGIFFWVLPVGVLFFFVSVLSLPVVSAAIDSFSPEVRRLSLCGLLWVPTYSSGYFFFCFSCAFRGLENNMGRPVDRILFPPPPRQLVWLEVLATTNHLLSLYPDPPG